MFSYAKASKAKEGRCHFSCNGKGLREVDLLKEDKDKLSFFYLG
ncbi:hypothetical protein Q428_04085 [Fervidicella metallireducens AeB]|uniref:Uncharacterized protein n=1 Tax=Fervidicella metallireducens AeB TaxID=1403537 RepID=A0A017RWW2_9CLOT|nr:hypothetical protein [Fervidicella metallireducens]EYE89167.1 hypothetical protein Q428_04085 [Fervidicella metallireducens AeB]